MSAVALIMFSAVDLETFLPIARKALGRGIPSGDLPPEKNNMTCLAGLIDGTHEDVEHLYSAAYIVAADERDMGEIIQLASMPHIVGDSATRGLLVAVISGTLTQWQDAVRRGSRDCVGQEARQIFHLIFKDLYKRSLHGTMKVSSSGTLLLESK